MIFPLKFVLHPLQQALPLTDSMAETFAYGLLPPLLYQNAANIKRNESQDDTDSADLRIQSATNEYNECSYHVRGGNFSVSKFVEPYAPSSGQPSTIRYPYSVQWAAKCSNLDYGGGRPTKVKKSVK